MPDSPYSDLTADELNAIAFYLDRPSTWQGFSDATRQEIRGLIERARSVAAELSANSGEDE